jgi:hypothetical protein
VLGLEVGVGRGQIATYLDGAGTGEVLGGVELLERWRPPPEDQIPGGDALADQNSQSRLDRR